MPANSWTPAFDIRPLTNQLVCVVGCGLHPTTHPGQPHCLPRGGPGYDWDIPLAGTYTMDVSYSMSPDRVGSFWVADHVEDLPSNHFHAIYFENLPRNLFETGGWASIAARNAFRLLASQGWVYIRTGADKSIFGPIYPALTDAGFAPVIPTYDATGWICDICAQKP
jgi:hypothetical protein